MSVKFAIFGSASPDSTVSSVKQPLFPDKPPFRQQLSVKTWDFPDGLMLLTDFLDLHNRKQCHEVQNIQRK